MGLGCRGVWGYIEGVCLWFVQVVMGGATLKGCVSGLSKW